MFFCPYCNAAIREDSLRHCPCCGSPLPPAENRKPNFESARNSWEDADIPFSGKPHRESLRRTARNRLSGNRWQAFFLILLCLLLLGLLTIPTLGIGLLLLFGPLSLLQASFFQQIHRQHRAEFRSMLRSFENFGKACCLLLAQLLMLLLCLLRLRLILGAQLAYAYSMCWYILNDHPELSGTEVIKASTEMMLGNRGQLFLLDLSFIGYWIPCLALFLLGLQYPILQLGTLLLLCHTLLYQSAARAAFYEELKARQTPRILPEAERPLWDRPDAEPAQEA